MVNYNMMSVNLSYLHEKYKRVSGSPSKRILIKTPNMCEKAPRIAFFEINSSRCKNSKSKILSIYWNKNKELSCFCCWVGRDLCAVSFKIYFSGNKFFSS
jgi:hypothetical protein